MSEIPSLESNPCGRLEALREIRDRVITGGQEIEAETEAGHGGRRRAKYSPANLEALDREIALAAEACNPNGARPRRYAIGGRL